MGKKNWVWESDLNELSVGAGLLLANAASSLQELRTLTQKDLLKRFRAYNRSLPLRWDGRRWYTDYKLKKLWKQVVDEMEAAGTPMEKG